METVKSVFGVCLLVVALYFLKDVAPALARWVPPGRGFVGAAAGAVLVGLGIGALHLSFHGAPPFIRLRKTLGIALVSVGAFAGLVALTRTNIPAYSPEEWASRGSTVLAEARAAHKPVVLDFGAEWCAACKELDRDTYPNPRVAAELKRFVFVKIDDREGQVAPKYGGPGLPYVVFFDSRGKLLTDRSVSGFRKPDDFLSILRSVD
jgi:thiol:disulfide interchange protein DsbD